MTSAEGLGQTGRVAIYEIADNDLAVGSTLGGPQVQAIIKANGAIEKVFSVDWGQTIFGTMILRHYDGVTGMYLAQDKIGTFIIHPERQEHAYTLANGVSVHEDIFVLRSHSPADSKIDPPGVYQIVEMRAPEDEAVEVLTYAFALLRGDTEHDVVATYDEKLCALICWNKGKPNQARIFGSSIRPESYETSLDYAKAVAEQCPGKLSCTTEAPIDPVGVLQHRHRLEPGDSVRFYYLLSCGEGRRGTAKNFRACPNADEALRSTRRFFADMLTRSVVLTPDPNVNRGVLWAKANMLRVETKAPTGWSFVNDPTRSNNSVGRDTAWFAFGADYLTPNFAEEALRAYVRLQEQSGMIVEYYDIRNDKTEDYGLNINDNTPLIIMALWHHYNATGDEEFLEQTYPAAKKAAAYILSQRNDQGLVWCTATGTEDWGIIGWRNVIPNYRLSGATTEVNAECFAALETVSHMARALGKHEESAHFAEEAKALKKVINEHLFNPDNGLYYLNIDLEGHPRSDVTSDLVFPVMFGVASDETEATIIGRLSNQDFWTSAGIRTTPRDAPTYTPNEGWGLLGGVWVAVSFWYAFAAAKHAPEFMAQALSSTFRNYSENPRRNNTVPGQFSEWLHGETLVNEGMMLSPWFPPRYLWAAIEGVAGLGFSAGAVTVNPRLAPDWKWLAVQNLPYRGRTLTWLAARMPELRIYTDFLSPGEQSPYVLYEKDVSHEVTATGDAVCALGLQEENNLLLFTGNTDERTVTTAVRCTCDLAGKYRLRTYNSLLGQWTERDELVDAAELERGLPVKMERKGFCVLDLRLEV